MDKTVRAVVGIFVVSAICSPLAELFKADFAADAFAVFEDDLQSEEDMRDYLLEAYRAELEKQIVSAARERGTEIEEIFISAHIDADNCIIIQDITVAVSPECLEQGGELSRFLSERMGVNVTVNAE